MQVELWDIGRPKPYDKNPRKLPAKAIKKVAASIKEFGFRAPIVVDGEGVILAGHTRLEAAASLGLKKVPVHVAEGLTPLQARAYRIADNRVAQETDWLEDALGAELLELRGLDFDLALTGFDAEELDQILGGGGEAEGGAGSGAGSLADRFLVPPFSVLNAREGWWQDRKRAWIALGIQSEIGRGEHTVGGGKANTATAPGLTWVGGDRAAGELDETSRKILAASSSGTSIFDPVLCELAYSWFSPPGGTVLDPFAGGSVRGIVASKLGRQYVGIELRPEQIAANRAQADTICGDPVPVWIEGDSRNIGKLAGGVPADFIFSCPPYADLERYSDDPRDLSTMGYEEFRAIYSEIIAAAAALLKPDRFACFVVGDVRAKDGRYYGFPWHTVQAFEAAGLRLYNEAVLVTAVGSLPIRVGKQFAATRKLGKTHQNVLVFIKGNAAKATKAIGECAFGEIEASELVA